MPTADPAVSKQPHAQQNSIARRTSVSAPRRLSRHTSIGLAILIALPLVAALPTVAAASAGPRCSGWHSLTQPPNSIRVLRRQSGKVEVVPFKNYVLTVLGKEWPGYLPMPVIESGAVAVKQYAWFHAMDGSGQRMTRDGRCYDVRDGTGDQLYKPNRSRIRADHYTALNATWSVSLRKSGNFFMTGYRRGNKANCGHDATGWKLFARSATRCAARGYNWREILKTYYGPSLAFVGDSGSGSAPSSTDLSFSTPDSTALTAPTSDLTAPTADPIAPTSDPIAPTSDQPQSIAESPDTTAAAPSTSSSDSLWVVDAPMWSIWRSDWQITWVDTLRASTVNVK